MNVLQAGWEITEGKFWGATAVQCLVRPAKPPFAQRITHSRSFLLNEASACSANFTMMFSLSEPPGRSADPRFQIFPNSFSFVQRSPARSANNAKTRISLLFSATGFHTKPSQTPSQIIDHLNITQYSQPTTLYINYTNTIHYHQHFSPSISIISYI